jgi:hypothetical protein
MTLLIKLTHVCGQTLVKYTVKTYLDLNVLECLLELLSRSPNSPKHLKSTNMKVVRFVEGHNFQ